MAILKKLVNVHPTIAIYGLTVPLLGETLNVELPIGDIRVALGRGAVVDEVIGKRTVRLDLSNYDKDNTGEVKEEVKVEPVKEEIKPDTENVSDILKPKETSTKISTPVVDEKATKDKGVAKVETKNTKNNETPITAKTVNQVNASTIEAAAKKINNIAKK